MESSHKTKWQVRIAILVIFAFGFVAGALSWNAYRVWRPSSLTEGRRDRYEQMLERLKLNPDQRAQVEKIFSDTRAQLIEVRQQSEPRVREIRKQTDERLQAVLTPEQWERFQRMKDELRDRSRYGREPRGR